MKEVSEKQGRTILFVSHNIGAVNQLCQTGILLEHGAIINQGEINDVANSYQKLLIS
jgi:lipopolysaccharide transport system ATP-binding protein